jgi:hypothetical protein
MFKRRRITIWEISGTEILEYEREDLLSGEDCPMEYWKQKSTTSGFPVLAKMAQRFLAIPASTGGVEGVFSIAGTVGRARRARMKSTMMGDIIMYRQHMKWVVIGNLARVHDVKQVKPKKRRRKVCTTN